MRSIRRSGRLITLFMIILTVLAGSASALAKAPEPPQFTATPLTPVSQYTATITKDIGSLSMAAARTNAKLVSVIVKLKTASLATYAGGIPGLAATSPQITGAQKVDPQSPDSKKYLAYVDAQQTAFAGIAQAALPSAKITHKFDILIGGVAMVVPDDQVAALSILPGVEAIYADTLQHIDTDASSSFIGATTLYPQLGGMPNAGKGVIFGVLDSGAWPEHPSFADNGNLAAAPAKADGTPRTCDFGDNPLTPANDPFVCNHKLIGGKGFLDTYNALQPVEIYGYTARDSNGHGTHTGTTAAGDPLASATVLGVDRGPVNGIAPGAWVSVYKVCGETGCYQSDSAAAVQQAIKDGVSVINFSISGGGNPYSDPVELAFLDAYNAGVFVAASAGNAGPGADTTDHRGPWVTTVAASRQTRAFESTLTLSAGGTTATFKGASITAGVSSPLPVVLASAAPYNDPLCIATPPPGLFTGKIVACQRGPGRVLKGFQVKQGGAAGMILYNTSLTDALTDNHWLPTVHLADGTQFLAFMAANPGVTGSFTQGTKVNGQGDVMAAFSSRGGPGQTLGISKPDITAPGVQILAGHTPTPESPSEGPPGQYFQAIAGTSMSSPHIAGSALLLKALHPSWTPGQIKSALMTTAVTKVAKENGTTPADAFDYGSGRVNLNVAGDPGLTFDVSAADYANPANRDQLYKLNYPSVYIPVFPGAATLTRTAHSVLPKESKWRLKIKSPSDVKIRVPSKLKVPAGGDAAFEITIDARDVPIGAVRFATLTLTQDGDSKRELHIPITILRQEAPITVTKTCTPASFPKKATTNCSTTITNTTFDAATVSLYDKLPDQLNLINNSVVGGTQNHNRVLFSGTLAGAQAPVVSIADGASPAGYIPLSAFGITPIPGVGDDTITNFTVPEFVYAGQTYTSIGFSSNGYAVVGGGNGPDNSITNQNFPDPTRPNNVLSPFWTDLNPGAAGAMRIATLTDGVNTWIVLDWAGVREFSTANSNSFEIWIGINGTQDVSFTYGSIQGNGDGGFLSVGAENYNGSSGQNTYYNDTGTLPKAGDQLVVSSLPGVPGESHTVTYTAEGEKTGKWVNYAELTSDQFFGTNIARFAGEVTKK